MCILQTFELSIHQVKHQINVPNINMIILVLFHFQSFKRDGSGKINTGGSARFAKIKCS